MKVYYSGNFWGGHKYEHAGREIRVNRKFEWGKLQWCIPSIYFCAKGLVIDFCVAILLEGIKNYYEQCNREKNPFSIDPHVVAKVNGKSLDHYRMCAVNWHPLEEERDQDEKVQEELLDYYSCDRSQGWRFIRICLPWNTSKKPKGKTISLKLEQEPALYTGSHILTTESTEPQEFKVIHPINDTEYKLSISEFKTRTLPDKAFQFGDNMRYPNKLKVLTYRISPELSMKEFMLQDCVKSDSPKSIDMKAMSLQGRSACSVGVIGCANGVSAIFVPGEGEEEYHCRMAYSSLHFDEVSSVEWRTMFYVKETEDIDVEIAL